jgi:transketolase
MMIPQEMIAALTATAHNLRCSVLEMISAARSGHPGGGLSAVEIMTALYFHELRIDPQNPAWPDRDRFVLSKGHGVAAWYAALGERGYFSKEHFSHFRQTGGILQGHPDMKRVPGVDMTAGSLGQGLSAALGMALAARLQGRGYRAYCLLGDGEIEEGQVWEAAMAAAFWRVDNLTAILDYNQVQLDGTLAEIMDPAPVADKWRAFNWRVIDCPDGHDIGQLLQAFAEARTVRGGPAIIIAHTVKGKGVSFMENTCAWHGVSDPSKLAAALAEVRDR